MRTRATLAGLLSLISGATCVFALEIPHTDEDCAAVFIGTVIRTEVLKTNAVERGSAFKWEQWRAEGKIQSVAKQDKKLDATVFVYYSHDHREPGGSYSMLCPAPPDIGEGLTARFQCVRREMAGFGSVLHVPSHLWIERVAKTDKAQSSTDAASKPEPSVPKRAQEPTQRGWRLQR